MILFRVTHTDLTRGVKRRYFPRAEFGVRPITGINLSAFYVTFFLGGDYGLVLATVFLVGEGLLKALIAILDSDPGAICAPGFDNADVMKCA